MSRDLRLDVSGIDLARLRSAVKGPGMFLFSTSVCPSLGEPARLTAAAGLNSGIADGMNDRALVNRIFLGSRITALYEPDGHAYTSVQHGGGWVEFQPIDPRQGPLAFWLITKRIAAERARPRRSEHSQRRDSSSARFRPGDSGAFAAATRSSGALSCCTDGRTTSTARYDRLHCAGPGHHGSQERAG